MTEYSRSANGSFTSTGAAKPINLPFQPTRVYTRNVTAWKNANTACIIESFWNPTQNLSGVNYTLVHALNSTTAMLTDYVTTGGISTFSAGQLLQFGARKQIVASTKGATTSFQVTSHGFSVGDVVIFEGLYQSATTGMPQMSGIPFSVTTVTDANNFIVTWNSNNAVYTNLSGSPSGAYVQKVLYPFLYEPAIEYINAITTGTTTTVTTTTPHNFETGQEIAFRIPIPWGPKELNSLPDALIPGSPIYGYVQSITDNFTFVCNINSTGFTAFTTFQTVASVPGLTPPQVLAVGGVNTGGNLYTGGALYPSPSFPTFSNRVPTINGPAIRGAFVNNTSQGFIIGAGTAATLTTAVLVGANNDIIEWEAFYDDINGP
jgi:hypothetical protein